MASVFDYIFNIGGNFTAQINGMSAAAGNFSAKAEVAESRGRSLAGTLATFSYLKDVTQNLADGVNALSEAGVRLDSQMHDLSAVAGVTGEGLKQIETFARESAKAFGTDASVAVEGYKLLLSQLSPELGKYPEALRAMGDCIQTTSKLMGGDGVAAAQVLTTAMNQYGVSLENPTAASEEMARMMNVMAAAGQAGSAELPAISAALQQCGMAAKAANVSFEETNAAIQVLDKGVKQGERCGAAMRDVEGQDSEGRIIVTQAREEEQAYKSAPQIFREIIERNNIIEPRYNSYFNIISNNRNLGNILNESQYTTNTTNYNTCFNHSVFNFANTYAGVSNVVKYESPNFFEGISKVYQNVTEYNNTIREIRKELISNKFMVKENDETMPSIAGVIRGIEAISEPRLDLGLRTNKTGKKRARATKREPEQLRIEKMLLEETMRQIGNARIEPRESGLTRAELKGIVMETLIDSLR